MAEAVLQESRICVVGSINIDYVLDVDHHPVNGETILSNGFNLIGGGKGANQASACARMGINTVMLGAVGNDSDGEFLLENLKASGVNTEYIKIDDSMHSGMAFINVDKNGNNTIVVEQGANKAVTIDYIEENIKAIEEADLIIMQLEIPIETVVHTAKRAREMGKAILLDPAPARNDLPIELFEAVNIIKPNEIELQVLSGIDINDSNDYSTAAKILIDRGSEKVVVTLGKKGALYFSRDCVRYFQGKDVKAVDTTCAGDSFTAALAFMISRGHSIDEAILYAIDVSSIVVTRKGAQSSIPTIDELATLYGMLNSDFL